MIKSSALTMGAVMLATAAGTYYGLESLPPGSIPPPIGRVHAAETTAAAPAPAVVAAAPVAPVAPVQPAADVASAEVTEQDLAEEPAPEPAAAEPTPEPAPAEPIVARAAPAESTPTAAPKSADTAEPAATPAPTETAKAESAAPAPAPATADADVIKPWWPDPAKLPANQLKLQYAGQVQGQPAIALLFTTAPKLDTLQQHASVKAANGDAVAGEWSLGKNPKLAVLSGLAPGRYTVILQPQVADEKGFMLGATLTGPVYVKQP